MKEKNVLHIRNMVCDRCIRVVREDLEKLGHLVQSIELGKVILVNPITGDQIHKVKKMLEESGFELLDDRQSMLVESIKTHIITFIHHQDKRPEGQNFSEFLAKGIGVNYYYLSKLFSTTEGITIEKYMILQKIERVKELLMYEEHSLSEIAFELGYSSVAHLSSQFKKTTGLSPSAFKKLKHSSRQPLDEIK